MNDLAQVVFEESPVGLAIVDRDFHFVRVNPMYSQITGYSEEELKSLTFADITHPRDVEQDVGLAHLLIEGKAPRYQIEKRYVRKSGEIRWVLLSVTLLRDPQGNPLHYLATVQDISEAKAAEGQLRDLAKTHRESELRYQQMLNTITDLVFVKDRESRLTWANRAFHEFFGFEPGHLEGAIHSPGEAPDDVASYLATDAVVLATGTTQAVEREPATRCDGARRLMSTVKSPLVGGDGRVRGLVGVARDVTERVALQRELDQTTAHFHALIQNALDIILVVDADGVQTFVSPSVESSLGWRPEELVGRRALEFIHPDDRPAVATTFRKSVSEPDARGSIEFRHAHKNGTWRYLEADGQNRLHDPAVAGVVVNSRDVTARRLAEQALAKREAYFRAIIEQSSDVITVLEPDGVIRYQSPSVARVLGYQPEDLVGRPMFELIHPDDVAAITRSFLRGLTTTSDTAARPPERYRCRHKDGSWVDLEGTGSVRVDDPDVRGIIGAARDVSDRAKSEAERERLIGELRTALTHVKTLSGLLPICSSCKRVRDDTGYWTQIEEYVRERTDADFSHGLCPTCAHALYPDFCDDIPPEPKR